MTKEWIRLNYEQDWDCEHIYYTVTEEGKMIKYDLNTEQTIEYYIDRVEH